MNNHIETARRREAAEMKLTKKELEVVDGIWEQDWAENIYGSNIHAYIKELEAIKDMSEEELREKYPVAYYWIDKWKKEAAVK